MFVKPGFTQHFAGVATNGHRNSSLKVMMIVKGEPMWELGNAAFIVGNMPKVFTNIFKLAFEATNCH